MCKPSRGEGGYYITEAKPVIRLADIVDNRRVLAQVLTRQAATAELVDLSAVTDLEISAPEVSFLVSIEHGLGLSEALRRRAIIAPTDFVYGMSRMYQALSHESGVEIEVFRNRDEAVTWLSYARE